ncbi:MAG: AAA family ATPase, partial [bacterium]
YIKIHRDARGKINIEMEPEEPAQLKDYLISPVLRETFLQKRLLVEFPLYRVSYYLADIFGDTAIYDFDPKLPKRAVPIVGKTELEEDGSNLALILKNLLSKKGEREQFLNLMRNLLPFINKLDVEKFADKSLLFKLREAYFNTYLPATLISDGTIHLTALILALYFERKPLVIIEEPERNIHPHLISKVVQMMKEASEKKQVIVTTHNPEVVRHAGLENLLLIKRDEDGFSTIFRPSDKEGVKTFLEQEIGIEELYVQDLLGV